MALTIKKIGVVGAGQMGNGIAHVAALAGFDVLINDVSQDRIKAGLATVNGNLARQVSRQRITEEQRKAALAHIVAADTFAALGDCDLVIEAATEKEDVKRKILAELCPVLRPDAIVAQFDDGSAVEGDVLLAGDGVHSRVRGLILPARGA